jgi:hypothetical protein
MEDYLILGRIEADLSQPEVEGREVDWRNLLTA